MADLLLRASVSGIAGQSVGPPAVASPLWRLVLPRASPIVRLNSVGRDPPIYCVHSASGDVTSFADLADALAPEQLFCGIQIPRADMTPAYVETIPAIARRHVEALVAFQPTGPLVLAGWSAGAVIALDMAMQLRAQGRDVPLLIAFDGAPCNTGGGMSRFNLLYTLKLLINLPGWFWCEFDQGVSPRALFRRMKDRIVCRARSALPRINNEGTLNGSAVQRVLELRGWRSGETAFVYAMHSATQSYVAKPYPGDVLVYEAKTHPRNHVPQIGAAWKRVAPHATVVRMSGNHVSMLRSHKAHTLASDLLRRMTLLHPGESGDTPSVG